jgi:hypothetical protein
MSSFYIKLGPGQASGGGAGLTDAQLRASPVPVSISGGPVNITGPVTISNEVEIKNDIGNAVPVSDAAVVTELQAIAVDLISIDSHVDGLEALTTSIDSKLTNQSTSALQTSANTKLDSLLTELQLKADLTETQPVSLTTVPLASGAATSALQTSGNASLSSIDSKLTAPLVVTGPLTDAQLRASVVPVSLTSTTITNFPVQTGLTDIELRASPVPVSGTMSVTGVATAANQATEISSLSSIDTKLTNNATSTLQTAGNASLASIDTKLSSQATAANQVTAQSSLNTLVADSALQATLAEQQAQTAQLINNLPVLANISKATILQAGTGSGSATQDILVAGTYKVSSPTLSDGDQSELLISSSGDLKVEVTNQPTSIDANITNSSLDVSGSIVSVGNTIDVNILSGAPAGLTDVELRAAPVPVSLSSTTISSSVLPTGAATSGLQSNGNASLVSIDSRLATSNASLASIDAGTPAALGQTTMSASTPVVIASNQSAIPVSLTSTTVTNTVAVSAASLPLPTNASTSALQTTGNTSLSNIDTKTPALGQALAASSTPVVIASNQTSVPIIHKAADLLASATGTAGSVLNASLPAAGAGLFHYITLIEVQAYSTAARTGSATPVVVTSANLPGAAAWTFGTAAAIGTIDVKVFALPTPLKCSTANTATVINCPATASVIWRVNIHYYTGV